MTLPSSPLTGVFLFLCFLPSSIARAQVPVSVPVFEVPRAQGTIKFAVAASVAIDGTFDRWDANLTFSSSQATSGVLDVKVYADSVNTGSAIKNSTLKGKDFFSVDENPLITFNSTRTVQTGPDRFELDGNFTIRGVTKPEKLTLTVSPRGTGSGEVQGTMAFDRRDYGMNSGIPFIRIANRVEVTVNLFVKRVSGPPLVFQQ